MNIPREWIRLDIGGDILTSYKKWSGFGQVRPRDKNLVAEIRGMEVGINCAGEDNEKSKHLLILRIFWCWNDDELQMRGYIPYSFVQQLYAGSQGWGEGAFQKKESRLLSLSKGLKRTAPSVWEQLRHKPRLTTNKRWIQCHRFWNCNAKDNKIFYKTCTYNVIPKKEKTD